MATKMPAAVATRASPIAGAITPIEAILTEPSIEKVSRMETTVPNSPINGDVEAVMERKVRPDVASLVDANLQNSVISFEIPPAFFIQLLIIELCEGVFDPI